jgi:serpin B
MRSLCAGVVCALALGACHPALPAVDARSAKGAATASNRFAFDLYDKLRESPGNMIFSPVSAEIALAMASAGARGETLDEMARVLHVDQLGDAHASFGNLLRALNGRDNDEVTVHLADCLWGEKSVSFHPAFLATLRDAYGSPLVEVDFRQAPDAAGAEINAWASKETHGRIRDIFGPGSLSPDTDLVLANAVYFKGAWVRPFAVSATADEDFTSPLAKTKVRMMQQDDWFNYARVGHAQIVELPYKGGFSMVVVLPDEVDGLPSVEGSARSDYEVWIEKLKRHEVDLKLPQWKTMATYGLVPPLRSLGMRHAFDAADFSGIGSGPLVIDQVIQKAFVESNEKGSEAAAVTVITGVEVSAVYPPPPPPAIFHADHPFLYFIRDPSTGVVLFVGRYVGPEPD